MSDIYAKAINALPEGEQDDEVVGSAADLAIKGSELSLFKKAKRFGLNDREEAFCRTIVRKRDIAIAYIQNIDSSLDSEEAYRRGVHMLQREDISHRVTKLEENRRIARDWDKESMVAEMIRMCSVNASDYFEDDEDGGYRVKPIAKWTENMKVACKGIEPTKVGWKITLNDKNVMIDKVSKMKSFYEEEDKDVNANNKLANKTDEELLKMIDTPYEEIK